MKVLSKGKKKFAAGFLLCGHLVFLLAFAVQNIHRASHFEAHCHLPQNECQGDACHLALVHHDQRRGCHHPTHLTAPDSFCSCGDLQQAVSPCILTMPAFPADHSFPCEKQAVRKENHVFCRIETDNRGPPCMA